MFPPPDTAHNHQTIVRQSSGRSQSPNTVRRQVAWGHAHAAAHEATPAAEAGAARAEVSTETARQRDESHKHMQFSLAQVEGPLSVL